MPYNGHFVITICEMGTQRVLFWYRAADADHEGAFELWGKPVGVAWDTYYELWFVMPPVGAVRLVPMDDGGREAMRELHALWLSGSSWGPGKPITWSLKQPPPLSGDQV